MFRMIRLLTIAVVCLLTVSPVLAAPFVPQSGEPPVIPSLLEALRLMATTGGVGVLLSFLATRSAWFQALAGDKRFWVIFGISMIVPIGATLVIQLVPPETLARLEIYWQAIAGGFMAFLGTQVAYKTLFKPDAKITPDKPVA